MSPQVFSLPAPINEAPRTRTVRTPWRLGRRGKVAGFPSETIAIVVSPANFARTGLSARRAGAMLLDPCESRAASILAEVSRGVARGCRHAIFLAVGTGIGAGILVNGSILRGAHDIAGAIAFYWDKVDHWLEEDEEIFGHPRDPYHRVDVRPSSRLSCQIKVTDAIDGLVVRVPERQA